ncbi:inorganic phosphate transporter [Thermaerobacillus caldiproteolyticus]|uniref:inorganic phosphate transporter n=1 Tax=Thermaerobacillus caldiproteolyticus TaxID=247480 RepID=UPI00188D6353|nr:inorganic phosphate transporter [Anoxybacillus caldiproteolyticus]QPA31336.1 anion permease [Anoxybacillus caldiproteolyticus]
MLITIAFIVSFFFAMNIGASGAAAAMGVAYGSGAIKQKYIALLLCGLGVFLGSLGGGEVVKTIGSGIIPSSILTIKIVIIILTAAAISLFAANIMGIPLSTSEITVGSIVGVGVAYQALYVQKLLFIASIWVIIPIIAFAFTFVVGKWFLKLKKKYPQVEQGTWQKSFMTLLIITGFFEAFSAGMNNVANAVGPLVGAGLISVTDGTIFGGLFVALGAILLGRRVLETNGKKITNFSPFEGIAISGTGAILVIISSIFGLPVPLTQIATSAIIGIGTAKTGFYIWQKRVVIQLLKVWLISPIFSLVISYSLVKLLLDSDLYTIVAIFSVCLATLGIISLKKTMAEENRSLYEDGSGI